MNSTQNTDPVPTGPAGVAGVLLYFIAAYLLLTVALTSLEMLLMDRPLGWFANLLSQSAGILACAFWACYRFSRRNGRTLTLPEKTRVVLGALVIELGLTAALVLQTRGTGSVAEAPEPLARQLIWQMTGDFAISALLHLAALVLAIIGADRLHQQRQTPAQARG